MKLVALAMMGGLSALLCLCGCKKKSPDTGTPAVDNTAAANPSGDGSKPSAPAPSAPGPVATAPYNPKLKPPPPGPPVVINGVTINVQNAERALATASWDANVALGDLRTSLRYEDFRTALGNLQKAASDPSVNEDQKNALAQVMQEIKQAAAAQRR